MEPRRLEPNAYLLKAPGFGEVLFGCPPEILKTLLRMGVMPSTVVMTLRTMRFGHSLMDVEFLLYAVMFFVKRKERLRIVCTEAQQRRLVTALKESLFCPSLRNLARSLMPVDCLAVRRRLDRSFRGDGDGRGTEWNLALDRLADRLEDDPEVFRIFDADMKRHVPARRIAERLKPFFRAVPEVRRGREAAAARAAVSAALIKRETRYFHPEAGEPDEVLARHLEFSLFDKEGSVELRSGRRRLRIDQPEACRFLVRAGGGRPVRVDMGSVEPPPVLGAVRTKAFVPPRLGVTFIGAGTGFAVGRLTTCSVAWVGSRGICVDALAEAPRHLRRSGISLKDVRHLVLTHIHGDHDAGVMQMVMSGEKIRLMTSRVVFDSFVRKAESVTCIPRDELRRLVEFVELFPGREVPIPGIPNARIRFDYSLHSIPTGRVTIAWAPPGGRRRTLFFSGDTRFEPRLFDSLVEQGFLTPARSRFLKGSGWDADLIVHEAGGEAVHTDLKDLRTLPASVKRKIWLNHLRAGPARSSDGMRFARDGQTVVLEGPERFPDTARRIAVLRSTGLFRRATGRALARMLREGRVVRKRAGRPIVREGTIGREFFVILEGLALIEKGGVVVNEYERADFFGELAVLSDDGVRHATVRAKTGVELLMMPGELYRKYKLPETIERNLYRLVSFFSEHTSSALMSSLAEGRLAEYPSGTDIIRIGAADRSVYILLSGSVEVLDAHQRRLAALTAVDLFGEIAALEGVRRTSTVRAASDARVLVLDEAEFRRIISRFPSFYATVAQKERKRLAAPETLRQVLRNEFRG